MLARALVRALWFQGTAKRRAQAASTEETGFAPCAKVPIPRCHVRSFAHCAAACGMMQCGEHAEAMPAACSVPARAGSPWLLSPSSASRFGSARVVPRTRCGTRGPLRSGSSNRRVQSPFQVSVAVALAVRLVVRCVVPVARSSRCTCWWQFRSRSSSINRPWLPRGNSS